MMKLLIQFRKTTPLLAIALPLLACFAMRSAPNAFGVVPPPDGGYPNFTTAEGTKALQNLTTGAGNTGVGWYSLFSATAGSFNTGIGAGTLVLNTADNNTAVGTVALFLNTTGVNNTAVGSTAILHNDDGNNNTGVGAGALTSNTTGNANTAVGVGALGGNMGGGGNTATGSLALNANNGNLNTAIGLGAMQSNTSGANNTAMGAGALNSNIDGFNNTACGAQALSSNTASGLNSAFGVEALLSNTTGGSNTAAGFDALSSNTFGSGNTAVGTAALLHNTSGSSNTALGQGAGVNVMTATNVICIGANGQNVDNSCYIGNIFNQTSVNGVAVLINSDNKLGTTPSSKRFKDEVKAIDNASEALFALKPVTFRYKKEIDPAGTSQFGLVAEDVEKVNPDLIVRDKEGKAYSVRYDQVNAMLLNEFLKEHRKNEQQEATIAQQRKDFEATIARLIATDTRQQEQIKALTTALQKVNAQLAAANPSLADLK